LLADGTAVSRVEIAFDLKEHDYLKQLDAAQCGNVLIGVMGAPVRVVAARGPELGKGRLRELNLGAIGDLLAAHFLHSTTMRRPGDLFSLRHLGFRHANR
jgi:hypothetical protein